LSKISVCDTDCIGSCAKELDNMEFIYRVRIGRRTMFRIFLAVLLWIVVVVLMCKFL